MIRMLSIGLALAAVMGCEQRTYDSFGKWSPDGEYVYFYTYRYGNADLMRMKSDGSEQKRLTRTFENEWWQAVSHDGARLAYTSNKGYKKTSGADLYVMPAKGGKAKRLTTDGGMKMNVSWSPDDAYIVYDSRNENGVSDLWLIPSEGGEPRNLTNTPDVNEILPEFRPDGAVVFLEPGATANLVALNIETGERVVQDQFPAGAVRPSFSPDGQKVSFSIADEETGKFDVYAMNADGSDLRRLTEHPDHDYAGGWSPDNSRLLFSTYRWGESEIYVMNADGSNKRNLTRTTADKD